MAEGRGQGQRQQRTREERMAAMDKEILDVDGAATVLGVSPGTIYKLARAGTIPAVRVGREWRFSRQNLINWIANGSNADQLQAVLGNMRIAKKT